LSRSLKHCTQAQVEKGAAGAFAAAAAAAEEEVEAEVKAVVTWRIQQRQQSPQ
jgi:hypothetical protein